MSRDPKQLQTEERLEDAETEDKREVYLRDGRKLVVSEEGGEQLVEIRAESGMLELRIRLTEQGPVLQMEAVKLQLKATEAIQLESEKVEIKGGEVSVEAEKDVRVEGKEGDVRVIGKKIWLN
jgi:NADPH-dependent glutamate synthase beta subunit-like oxidoreductase